MRELLSAWDWGEPVTAEHVPAGLINRTFWVKGTTTGGVLAVLQELNTKIFRPAVHHDIEAVTAQVERKGMITPKLVRTRRGDLWATDRDGGVWRRMTVVGNRTIHKLDNPGDARSAGALVARFHAAVSDLDYDFQMVRPDVHDTARHMRGMDEAIANFPDHRLAADVQALAEDVQAQWTAWNGPTDLPKRVVHGDLKISNVRFDDDRALALIDLDTLARRTLDVELGDAMRSWCNPVAEDALDARFDVALFTAAMEGYARGVAEAEAQGVAGPTDDEWASIVPCTERIALELSARFAKDALEESYFGWDERFGGRGEHNLVRAQGQAKLAKSLADQRAAADAAVAHARSVA
ncbi:MAG: phosphotransferase [Myxococcota bacterium]